MNKIQAIRNNPFNPVARCRESIMYLQTVQTQWCEFIWKNTTSGWTKRI